MIRRAIISPCGRYRYTLERIWEPANAMLLMLLMLNPSTADAQRDDSTIVRVIGFGQALGFGGVLVGNLYAYRTAYPKELHAAHRHGLDVTGGETAATRLRALADRAHVVCAAWGADTGPIYGRAAQVTALLGRPLYCLGRTKGGQPRHPLYLRSGTPLTEYA